MPFATTIEVPIEAAYAIGLLLGLGFLVNIASGIVSIWSKTRRQPPIDDTFVKQSFCNSGMGRVEQQIKGIQEERRDSVKTLHAKIDGLQHTMETVLRDFARDLGGLEGMQKMQRHLMEDKSRRSRLEHDNG